MTKGRAAIDQWFEVVVKLKWSFSAEWLGGLTSVNSKATILNRFRQAKPFIAEPMLPTLIVSMVAMLELQSILL